MKRGEHLPMIECAGAENHYTWKIVCACGATFQIGDTYQTMGRTGKVATRKVRTLADAKVAHAHHYASEEAASYCEHPVSEVRSHRLVCADCAEPL